MGKLRRPNCAAEEKMEAKEVKIPGQKGMDKEDGKRGEAGEDGVKEAGTASRSRIPERK